MIRHGLFALAALLASASFAAEVHINRDDWGIAHITAPDWTSAAWARGFAEAEDRLDQIYTNYRTAIGRMAEVDGERWVDQDFTQRMWRHEAIARAWVKGTSGEPALAEIVAYQNGVRAFLAAHPERRSRYALELEPHLAVALLRAVIFHWPERELAGDLGRSLPGRAPYSNEWAVAPARTAFGGAMLLIDPHLPWDGPVRFYEHHVAVGDERLCGFGIVGAPGVGLGHNRRVAWAMTTGGPDTGDIFVLDRNPNNRDEYLHDGSYRKVESETVKIAVRQRDGTMKTVERTVQRTLHGPALRETADKIYAARTTYADTAGLAVEMRAINHARNMHEFMDALGMLQLMAQNVMGADANGNIFYLRNGRTPVRPEGFNWSRAVPGGTTATAWLGVHPPGDLLRIVNPKTGYMQNCNISPGMMAHVPLVDPNDYPAYIYNDDPNRTNSRGLRAVELLRSATALTRDAGEAIALDVTLPEIPRVRALLSRMQTDGLDAGARKLYDLVFAWDGAVSRDSVGATAFRYFAEACGRAGLAADPVGLSRIGSLTSEQAAVARQALSDAAARLQRDHGSLEVPWGKTHRVERGGSWPVGGSSFGGWTTLRAMDYDARDGRAVGAGGQSHTMLVCFFPDGVRSWSVTPFGVSDDPKSPHYNDQTRDLFSPRKMKPTWFDPAELSSHVEHSQTLSTTP